MAKQIRRFDGKRYELEKFVERETAADDASAKRKANRIADELRERGKSARVTKEGDGYAIWVRKKARKVGQTAQTALGKKTPGKVGGTKDFVYRLISKTTGEESFHKVNATGKVAAFNYLRAKYHNSTAFTFGGVYTKQRFAKIAWDQDLGGMRTYVRPTELRYRGFPGLTTSMKHQLTEKAWDKHVNDTRHVKWITIPVAREAVKAAGTRWMTV